MSDRLFLNSKEMYELTGYSHADKQIEVLKLNGTPFSLTGQGKPRVCRAVVEGRQSKASAKAEKKEWSPQLAIAS